MRPSTAAPSRALTIAQLVMGILGLLFSLGGLLALIIGLRTPGTPAAGSVESALLWNFLLIVLVIMLLTIPAVTTAIRSLAGLPPRQPIKFRFMIATIALLLVLFLIWLDRPNSSNPGATWPTSIINVLTILIPIWWFLELGRARLAGGSAKRHWGIFSFSTYFTLPIILLVEVIIIGFGILFAALWLIQQPEFAPFLSQLGSLSGFDPAEWESLLPDLLPLLSRPGVIAALTATATLVVPLIEEMLKPLGIWLLHKRNLTPAEGFTIGMICGAAFALLESLFSISAVTPGDRLFVITGRLGTGLLHIFTAGLNGWALATTWRDGKFLRAGVSFTLSVLIHGAWNLFALLLGMYMIGEDFPFIIDPSFLEASAWVLPGIAFFLLLGLIGFNLHLRRTAAPPPLPQLPGDGLG